MFMLGTTQNIRSTLRDSGRATKNNATLPHKDIIQHTRAAVHCPLGQMVELAVGILVSEVPHLNPVDVHVATVGQTGWTQHCDESLDECPSI